MEKFGINTILFQANKTLLKSNWIYFQVDSSNQNTNFKMFGYGYGGYGYGLGGYGFGGYYC